MHKILTTGLAIALLFGAGIASAQTYGCVNLASDLSYGMQSASVSSLQSFLVAQNYPGGGSWMVTGYYGNATTQAVRNFQQSQGIPMTGVADAATRAAIARQSGCQGSAGYSYGQYQYSTTYPYLSYPYQYDYNTYNNYTYSSAFPYSPNYPYPYGTTLALTSMSQNTGAPGSSITLYGTGFDLNNNTVHFGDQTLSGIPSQSGTSLTFTVPSYYSAVYSYNQSVQVYVTTARGTSNSLAFTVTGYPYQYGCGGYWGYDYSSCNPYPYPQPSTNYSSPTITYLQPAQGGVGTSVTVYGSGFTTSGNTVHFGNGIITNLGSNDGRSVSFIVPSTLTGYGSQPVVIGPYNVSVTNGQGYTTNAMPFSVTSTGGSNAAPTISSVNGPTSVQAGAQNTWTIQVSNPSGQSLTTSVRWGDESTYGYTAAQQQTTYAQGQTTLTFTHAYYSSGSYTIRFTVSNQAGQSNTSTMTVSVGGSTSGSVQLNSLSPSVGAVGTQVTIFGTGFTQNNTIHFGTGAIQNAYSPSGTSIQFIVPAYISPYCPQGQYCAQYVQSVTPGSYNVSVENSNGTSGTLLFQVQ